LQGTVLPVLAKYIAIILTPTVANSAVNGDISIRMAVTVNATGAAMTPGLSAAAISGATNRDP
jgi:hypothetical protein